MSNIARYNKVNNLRGNRNCYVWNCNLYDGKRISLNEGLSDLGKKARKRRVPNGTHGDVRGRNENKSRFSYPI